MKRLLSAIIITLTCIAMMGCSGNEKTLTGAGSSFIFPALSIWTKNYDSQKNVQVNYQAIGSGGGLQQMYSGTIDFAASDVPLKTAELAKHKLKQFPMLIGGIVLAINLPNVASNKLVLSSDLVEEIYSGTIQYWDDQAIKRINAGVILPHKKIVTIHRADGSGTTFNFTNYLSKVSSTWEKNVGANTTVAWPGNGIGAKGNAGVAAQILQTPYSIGYVEYAYAKQNNMTITKMINRAQQTVTANASTFAAAAENANWNVNNGFYQMLTDQPGKNSWPIVATTFVLYPDKSKSPTTRQQTFDFFKWCLSDGSQAAEKLDYVAIPKDVATLVIASLK